MSPRNVILLACGTFNPITNMHLRMFEIARDHLQALGHQRVIGGIVSPVHDEYGKKDLESSTHRCAMIRLALENCDWIRLSSWECQQEGWTRTRATLQYHQNQINAAITESSDSGGNKRARLIDGLNWMPPYAVLSSEIGQVQVKFLCGADLLESFGKPGLWNPDDVEAILSHHGLVVITREGTDPYHFIYESDLLTKYQNNIIIVNEWIRNEISSTKIRRALRRQQSAKYLIQDAVLDYILKLGLYQGISDNNIKETIANK